MLRILLMAVIGFGLAACVSSRDQMFMNMSDTELAQYNAALPAREQIVCQEGIRPGTVGLVRKVCTSKSRMSRLTSNSGSNNPEFMGSSAFHVNRVPENQVFFSRPPPGFDTPIIHVIDYRP